jgi:cell shape-determining protein MreC
LPPYGTEPESSGRQRDFLVAGFVLILAASTLLLSGDSQQRIASALQQSALRPFIGVQRRLEDARMRAAQVDSMLVLVDSLSSMLSTHAALLDENRTLRSLLDLSERSGPRYLPATVLRPGTPGAESMFIVDVGSAEGVVAGSPVVGPFGLVGVVREVREREAVGMDWTHPDFRASAMLANGAAFGLVENRRGRFREEDRLLLNGIPFNQAIEANAVVVTSGLGGVFPRGIPIGRIEGLADSQGDWRKSYWLTPMVEPGSATHVLVITGGTDEDVTGVWPADSAAAPGVGVGAAGAPPRG